MYPKDLHPINRSECVRVEHIVRQSLFQPSAKETCRNKLDQV